MILSQQGDKLVCGKSIQTAPLSLLSSGHILKILVEIDDPTDAEVSSLERIADRARYAIAFQHQYSDAAGDGDRMFCYMAMRSQSKKTPAVWRRLIPRGIIYDAESLGSDARITSMCARGNQTYAEFCADSVDGENYGDGDPFEVFSHGSLSHRGTDTKLVEIRDAIQDGMSAAECATNGIGGVAVIKFAGAISMFESQVQRKRDGFQRVEVIVLHGPSGSGKTRYVHTRHTPESLHVWTPSFMTSDGKTAWFDSYSGQRYVLFDEFRGQIDFSALLTLLDGYPGTKVQVKGGSANWCPDVIYLASTTPMRDWYPKIEDGDHGFRQLERRVTRTITFPHDKEPTPTTKLPPQRRQRVD